MLFLLLLATRSIAQQNAFVYDDRDYRPEIKSVQFGVSGKDGSFPLISLRGNEQLLLAFDDLVARSRNYYYSIEHCDAKWQPSNLSPAEYLQSFTEDRLMDYRYSVATRQKYVHYELLLPNQSVAPKIAGNYLLKVYEFGNQNSPVLTRRMYVLDSKVSLFADIAPSPNNDLRQTNQKINLRLDYAGLNVQNPNNDIRTFIMQNARPQTGQWSSAPSSIRGTQLIYNDYTTYDFAGGAEFRHFDIRSLQVNSDRVNRIYRDSVNTVILLTDHPRDRPNYTFEYDNNGKFFINNQDGRDARTDADYAHVYFSMACNKTGRDGDMYIVGQFNNWQPDAASKLTFDNTTARFYINLFLKQGVYDYAYVWVDAATHNPDYSLLEGNHFETENDYQVLVYYRPVSARWDELAGYRLLNNSTKR